MNCYKRTDYNSPFAETFILRHIKKLNCCMSQISQVILSPFLSHFILERYFVNKTRIKREDTPFFWFIKSGAHQVNLLYLIFYKCVSIGRFLFSLYLMMVYCVLITYIIETKLRQTFEFTIWNRY